MINKVNRPDYLSLIASPKASENDPGSSQGSGNFYEGPESKKDSEASEKKADLRLVPPAETDADQDAPHFVEQIGMTEVVKDLHEIAQQQNGSKNAGLTVKYQTDGAPAKGMLLNKKAE